MDNAAQGTRGVTLTEVLIVVVIVGILAAAIIPLVSFQDSRLDVAAGEVANALRFAVSESARTGGYVLVDCKTAPGHLKLATSDAGGNNLGAINDPLTKRALDIDVAGSTFSQQVTMTPQFIAGAVPYHQLLIGPAAMRAFDGSSDMGSLAAGSQVVLSSGGRSTTVSIDAVTRRVTLP